MIDAVWYEVFQRIPAEQMDSVSIQTLTGAELVVQQVFKYERNFMVCRARTAGTMDSGRTIIVAYAQIDFIAFNKRMAEEDVNKLFGDPMPEFAAPAMAPVTYQPAVAAAPIPFAATPPKPAQKPAPKPASTPATEAAAVVETVTETAPEPAAPAQKPGQISKTLLLARLRERLAEKTK